MIALLNYWRGFGRMSRDARLFVLHWAFICFAFFGVQGVLANLFLLRIGFGPEFIGIYHGIGWAVSVAVALLGAAIGGRIGHRNTMLACSPVYIAASTMVVVVERLAPAVRAPWLLASQVLFWLGASVHTVNQAPYIMRVAGSGEREYVLAIRGAASSGGGFLGALAAGWLPGLLAARLATSLDAATPFRLSLLLAPLAYLVATLVLLGARPDPPVATDKAPGETPEGRAPQGVLFFMGMLMFMIGVAQSATTFFNVYLDAALGVSPARIGALMGTARLAALPAAAIIPLILSRWGTGPTLLGTKSFAMVTLVIWAIVPAWSVVALTYMALLVVNKFSEAASTLLSQESVSPRWRGTIAASCFMGSSLGMASAASFGGYLIVAAGYRWLFLAAAGAAFLAVGMLSLYLRRHARRLAAAPAGPAA